MFCESRKGGQREDRCVAVVVHQCVGCSYGFMAQQWPLFWLGCSVRSRTWHPCRFTAPAATADAYGSAPLPKLLEMKCSTQRCPPDVRSCLHCLCWGMILPQPEELLPCPAAPRHNPNPAHVRRMEPPRNPVQSFCLLQSPGRLFSF